MAISEAMMRMQGMLSNPLRKAKGVGLTSKCRGIDIKMPAPVDLGVHVDVDARVQVNVFCDAPADLVAPSNFLDGVLPKGMCRDVQLHSLIHLPKV